MTLRLLIPFFCFCAACFPWKVSAQNSPLPAGTRIDLHADFSQYTPYVVPCINWLQQTPLDQQIKERYRLDEFVMHWLERNPDIDISMPDYSLKFHGIHREFLYLFMEGWIKYTLETKDVDHVACNMAGLRSMLNYYLSGKAVGIGKVDYLENLNNIEKSGMMSSLFDTARNARNTYVYLKAPVKHDFRHDENYFSFYFYTINLIRPRKIVFRYMLEGYYDNWITTTDGTVTYPRLPPGNYNFRVQASMSEKFEQAVETNYSFSIQRPFWAGYWFLTLVGISIIGLVFLFIRQREKNLRKIALLQHQRIMFEYEHLKSQVNPHFLFNSFNTLSHLIAKDQAKASDYAEKLSELYHNIIAYHDKDLVLLSEEFAILDNYMSIQKGRFGDALRMEVNIPDEIMEKKKVIPLALQILIENAIKHNVISASSPLVISIVATEDEIMIENDTYPKLSKEKGGGLGLVNIKRRYELLTKKPVKYGLHDNKFIVILPLL